MLITFIVGYAYIALLAPVLPQAQGIYIRCTHNCIMNNILNYVGNKESIADLIIKEFTPHSTYIELFFGSGGIFFNKPRARFNVLNDKNNEVINLWKQVTNNPDELIEMYLSLPIHDYIFKNKTKTGNDITDAAIFLLRSNMSLYGGGSAIRTSDSTDIRAQMPKLTKTLSDFCKNCIFFAKDYSDCLKAVKSLIGAETFIYADPPYIDTAGGYIEDFNPFKFEKLCKDLIEIECKFAISEFDNESVLRVANKYGLNILYVCVRKNIKNERKEILITNYTRINTLF